MTMTVEWFEKMLAAQENGIAIYKQARQADPNLPLSNIANWDNKGLPILRGDLDYAKDALIKAQNGDPSYQYSMTK